MSWFYLVVAGFLEVVWATAMERSAGFTRPLPTGVTLVALAGSMGLLGLALRDLPLGTAYAVWVGIGAVGTAVLGIILFGDPAGPLKLVSLALVVAGIAGLKLSG